MVHRKVPDVIIDKWTLTAEFDTAEEAIKRGADEIGPGGEAEEFYRFVRKQAKKEWGFLKEEVHECVEKDGDTVRVSLDLIDPFSTVYQWILFHSVPERVTLERYADGYEGGR